jgi:hypothetical protein
LGSCPVLAESQPGPVSASKGDLEFWLGLDHDEMLFFVLPDLAKGSDPSNICGGCSSGAKLFEAGPLSSTAKPAATSQSPRRELSVRGVPGGDVVGTARPRHHGQSAGSSSARKRFLIRSHGGDLHREPPPRPDPRVACSKVVPSWD